MKIELEATGKFEGFQGVRCRIWKGEYKGNQVVAYIPCIGLHNQAPQSAHVEWGRELETVKAERQLVSFDTRLL